MLRDALELMLFATVWIMRYMDRRHEIRTHRTQADIQAKTNEILERVVSNQEVRERG